MSENTKNKNNTVQDTLNDAAQQAGLVLMVAATTLGLVEIQHEQPNTKLMALPNQPALVTVTEHAPENSSSTLRREREETSPHYVSYSVSQRTPGRTGKI